MDSRHDKAMSPKPSIDPSKLPLLLPQQDVVVEKDVLIFPAALSPAIVKSMEVLLAGIEFNSAQCLLDELSGRMKISEVKNKIGYLAALKKRFLASEFTQELGIQVKENRNIENERISLNIEREKNIQCVVSKSEVKSNKSIATQEFKELLASLGRKKSQ